MKKVVYKRTEANADRPTKIHGDSYGYELYNTFYEKIPAKSSAIVSAGITLEKNSNLIGFVLGNPSLTPGPNVELSHRYICMGNELGFRVQNFNSKSYEILPGKPISRLFLLKISGGEPNIVDSLDNTERGEKGYGSTGVV